MKNSKYTTKSFLIKQNRSGHWKKVSEPKTQETKISGENK